MATAQIPKQIVIDAAEKLNEQMKARGDEAAQRSREKYLEALEFLRKPSFPRFWTIPLEKAKRRWPFDSRDTTHLELILGVQRRAHQILVLAKASHEFVTLSEAEASTLNIEAVSYPPV